ncbi:MAG TPA: S1/P1 nuclease [Candidatus Binatia bacterium]|nr:S1/P1 nuclease [Candidatus Binatia bacterium]
MPTSRVSPTVTFVATFFAFNLLTSTPSFSWFDKGHRIVALIAQANLSAEARKEIDAILPANTTLADAAVWPDHEGRSNRDFNPLHYVSIPENATGYDQGRDCPERNCMVEALKSFSLFIADKNAPIMMRRFVLYYIAHLVGDMHQPLHAGRAGDRGGVDLPVSYRGVPTNLHFFWDKDLVDLESGTEEEIAKRLTEHLTAEERLKWLAGDPIQWTNESLMLVRSHAYNTGASIELSEDYVEKPARLSASDSRRPDSG